MSFKAINSPYNHLVAHYLIAINYIAVNFIIDQWEMVSSVSSVPSEIFYLGHLHSFIDPIQDLRLGG